MNIKFSPFLSDLIPTKLCFRRSERQIMLYSIIWVELRETNFSLVEVQLNQS